MYDSLASEIVDEDKSSLFNVIADLQMIDIKEEPKESDYYFGNQVNFKFSLKDSISGRYVSAMNPTISNVFLVLKHERTQSRQYVFANQSATQFIYDGRPGIFVCLKKKKEKKNLLNKNKKKKTIGFQIKWDISPNIISGSGMVAIDFENPDGKNFLKKKKKIE